MSRHLSEPQAVPPWHVAQGQQLRGDEDEDEDNDEDEDKDEDKDEDRLQGQGRGQGQEQDTILQALLLSGRAFEHSGRDGSIRSTLMESSSRATTSPRVRPHTQAWAMRMEGVDYYHESDVDDNIAAPEEGDDLEEEADEEDAVDQQGVRGHSRYYRRRGMTRSVATDASASARTSGDGGLGNGRLADGRMYYLDINSIF
ncbi:hypothetical protein BGZ94_002683 [Podila epigama]|nr:hypothetical protein BGZ94_002683 [Podila epigama]